MKITIKAEPKEIAAIVVALQERQTEIVTYLDGKEIYHRTNPVKSDSEIQQSINRAIESIKQFGD